MLKSAPRESSSGGRGPKDARKGPQKGGRGVDKGARDRLWRTLGGALFIFIGVLWRGISWGAELPVLYVALIPQKEVAEGLVGGRFRVEALLPPGADPHTFEPKPHQMVDLARARAYISAGLPFEGALVPRLRGAAPELVVVAGDGGIDKIAMTLSEELFAPEDSGDTPSGPSQPHGEDGGADPHFWTSPRRMAVMARTMAEALEALDPAGAEEYRKNLGTLEEAIAALDEELRALLAGCRGMAFFVFHPAWGYLAADYGLRQIPIEVEGKEPKAADLARLVLWGRERGVRVIFVSPQFSRKGAAAVAAEIGATLVDLDPLAPGWMENLRRAGHLLHDAVK